MTDKQSDYVAIELDPRKESNHAPLQLFSDEQVINHIHDRLSMVYEDITIEYVQKHFGEMKNRLGMYYPSDYLEESYTNFQTAADTGYYHDSHQLSIQSNNMSPIYIPIKDECNTFLVNKKMDFIFTYLIDIITITQHYNDKDEIARIISLTDNRFNERMKLHKLCKDPDCIDGACFTVNDNNNNNNNNSNNNNNDTGNKNTLCSMCWIIYTRIDSDFYHKSMTLIQSNKVINFTSSAYESMDIEHKLFSLVLFLCMKSILPETKSYENSNYSLYSGVNKWVSLPLWFHLLLQIIPNTNKSNNVFIKNSNNNNNTTTK